MTKADQILTNNVLMLILCLSYFITTVTTLIYIISHKSSHEKQGSLVYFFLCSALSSDFTTSFLLDFLASLLLAMLAVGISCFSQIQAELGLFIYNLHNAQYTAQTPPRNMINCFRQRCRSWVNFWQNKCQSQNFYFLFAHLFLKVK